VCLCVCVCIVRVHTRLRILNTLIPLTIAVEQKIFLVIEWIVLINRENICKTKKIFCVFCDGMDCFHGFLCTFFVFKTSLLSQTLIALTMAAENEWPVLQSLREFTPGCGDANVERVEYIICTSVYICIYVYICICVYVYIHAM